MNTATVTVNEIDALGSHFNLSAYLPADWQGTVVDLLKAAQVPADDRVRIALRSVPAGVQRRFAIACVRRLMADARVVDPRTLAAVETAERYADGLATEAELIAANAAAQFAAAGRQVWWFDERVAAATLAATYLDSRGAAWEAALQEEAARKKEHALCGWDSRSAWDFRQGAASMVALQQVATLLLLLGEGER